MTDEGKKTLIRTVVAILIILTLGWILSTKVKAQGNWVVKKHRLEKYTYVRQAWPKIQTCATYIAYYPVKMKAIKRNKHWRCRKKKHH